MAAPVSSSPVSSTSSLTSQFPLPISYTPLDITKAQLNHPTKVLSICGGGVRGIIPAYILSEMETRTKLAVHEIFDLCAGTSTGSLVVSPLVYKSEKGNVISAAEVVNLFKTDAKDVFYETWGTYLSGEKLGREPKYSQNSLEKVVNQFCGRTAVFKNALTEICFPSWDMCTRKPFLFLRREALKNDFLGNLSMTDVLCSTTAAPTYFSARKITLGNRNLALMDGGMVTNDPCEFAYKEAQKIFNCGNNIITCNLGTGYLQYNTSVNSNLDLGTDQWLENGNIINSFIEGGSQGHELLASYDYDKSLNNIVIQPTIRPNEEVLDDASVANLDNLEQSAKTWIEENENLFRDFCKSLKIGKV